jgi:hypothetical protein
MIGKNVIVMLFLLDGGHNRKSYAVKEKEEEERRDPASNHDDWCFVMLTEQISIFIDQKGQGMGRRGTVGRFRTAAAVLPRRKPLDFALLCAWLLTPVMSSAARKRAEQQVGHQGSQKLPQDRSRDNTRSTRSEEVVSKCGAAVLPPGAQARRGARPPQAASVGSDSDSDDTGITLYYEICTVPGTADADAVVLGSQPEEQLALPFLCSSTLSACACLNFCLVSPQAVGHNI